jgi:transposase
MEGRGSKTNVHRELRRPGITRMLLWEEYRQAEPEGYGYGRWCELYRLGGPAVADNASAASGR